MKRRSFILCAGAIGAAALAAPGLISAATHPSGTPVVNGKRVRRRLSSLGADDAFFAAYERAVEAMHALPDSDPRSWFAQARVHAQFCAHGTDEFFPWHRPYLLYFEKICGSLIGDADFALPYWDWPDASGRLPAAFFTNNGALNVQRWNDNGQYDGPGWSPVNTTPYRWARADFGLIDSPMAGDFSAGALSAMENAPDFGLLRQLTENPHGAAHVMIGGFPNAGFGTQNGHMSSGLSPLDPIFWLHHSNVDRIWAQSAIPVAQQIGIFPDPDKVYSGMFHDQNGASVSPVLRDQFDLAAQDYTYDFLVPELLSTEQIALQNQALEARPQLLAFAQQRGLKAAFAPPETIGGTDRGGTTRLGAINTISVETEGLTDALTDERLAARTLALAADVLVVTPKRIIARFRDVRPTAAAENRLVKLFVDCPYLSNAVPTTDPHYAGVLSFFGCSPDICASRDFSVDVTAPMRYRLEAGLLNPRSVQLQLLAFNADGSANGEPLAEFGAVELISV